MGYQQEDQEQKQQSKWGKCSASGCPLESSFNTGESLCSFHGGEEKVYFPEITMAINEYFNDYKKYCQMVNWSPKLWTAKRPLLESDGKVNMSDFGKDLRPNLYIDRFYKYLHASIKTRSSDLIHNPSQRPVSTDQYSDDGLWRN